ncbi:hypothetical protein HanPSC8_Chr08g0327921 [Helianthus annuus]|nr:hypothetical protein HanPSC8_Chr08g0327921 [Helianthus annuus]
MFFCYLVVITYQIINIFLQYYCLESDKSCISIKYISRSFFDKKITRPHDQINHS